MFGYVRPLRAELKVREFEQYKAAYCGLCHALKDAYGSAARFCVNYDLTFLAMLLSRDEPVYAQKRCMANCALKKKRCCVGEPMLKSAAACSVILCWWKLQDSYADGGFWDKLKAFMGKAALRRAYKKAAADLPDFANTVEQRLKNLSALERSGCDSLDRTAEEFARLLCAAVPREMGEEQGRILAQLLYHVGRWIYIVDAADDLKEDMQRGGYNPIALRFALQGNMPEGEEKAWLEATLKHSINLAGGALELLDDSVWSPILRNIIYLGLPTVTDQVLEGKFVPEKRRHSHN